MVRFFILSLVLAGFIWADKVFVIDVEGMYCKMCPVAVKKAISQLEGVKWVKAYLDNKMAVVVAEENVKGKDILNAISKAGDYKGRILDEKKF